MYQNNNISFLKFHIVDVLLYSPYVGNQILGNVLLIILLLFVQFPHHNLRPLSRIFSCTLGLIVKSRYQFAIPSTRSYNVSIIAPYCLFQVQYRIKRYFNVANYVNIFAISRKHLRLHQLKSAVKRYGQLIAIALVSFSYLEKSELRYCRR